MLTKSCQSLFKNGQFKMIITTWSLHHPATMYEKVNRSNLPLPTFSNILMLKQCHSHHQHISDACSKSSVSSGNIGLYYNLQYKQWRIKSFITSGNEAQFLVICQNDGFNHFTELAASHPFVYVYKMMNMEE